MKTEHWALLLGSGISLLMWTLRGERAQALGLEEYDAEQRRYKPVQPKAATEKQRLQGWELIEGKTITLDPTRKYAATFQIDGARAWLASASAVADELRSHAEWQALDVWGDPETVPKTFPAGIVENVSGRYWAIGVPAKAKTFERPPEVVRLWSAPWEGFK